MDKELLRLVIILIGMVVIIGLLFWSYLISRKRRRGINFYDKKNPFENIDESLKINIRDDDFEIVPLGSVNDVSEDVHVEWSKDNQDETDKQTSSDKGEMSDALPAIMHFSLLAKSGTQFKGTELADIFTKVGLEYGSVKVFERLDEHNKVHFTVANMIEPGIFPDAVLESFSSPGIVFFMQREQLDDAVAVFDDLVNTMQLIAQEIGGEARDQYSDVLTPHSIRIIREKLISY